MQENSEDEGDFGGYCGSRKSPPKRVAKDCEGTFAPQGADSKGKSQLRVAPSTAFVRVV